MEEKEVLPMTVDFYFWSQFVLLIFGQVEFC